MHVAYQIKGSYKTNGMVPFSVKYLQMQHRNYENSNSLFKIL